MSKSDGYVIYIISVDGVIRYVGRSNNAPVRMRQHLREARSRSFGLLSRKLAKAIQANRCVEQIVLSSGLSREAAALAEIAQIAALGGHVRRGRQLWNTHSGGLGGASLAAAKALKVKWATDSEYREKVSKLARDQVGRQRTDSPEFEARRIKGVQRFSTTSAGTESLARARACIDRNKQRAAVSKALKSQWENPEYRSRKLLSLSQASKKRWADPLYRKQQAAAVSAALKGRKQTSEAIAKRVAGRRLAQQATQ